MAGKTANKGTNCYVFQTSWEVCNKIGGIYTVLSTQAKSLHDIHGDNLIYVGPYFENGGNLSFTEDDKLFSKWIKAYQKECGVTVKAGRWNVPGEPIAILIDFKPFYEQLNDYLFEMWNNFQIDSMNAYGDYNEAVTFGLASAKTIEHFCEYNKLAKGEHIAQFHEWTTGSGVLYCKSHVPYLHTVFTTHATTIGRSICFNNKQLYEYFDRYNGDQMASELNVKAKHLVEKQAAHNADCFTTVSDLTAKECAQLLEKQPDIVTPNGFEAGFIPQGAKYTKAKKEARATLKNVAENLIGHTVSDDALFIGTGGRYEYRNKGIDVFLESMRLLAINNDYTRETIVFVMVPGWNIGPRKDLQSRMEDPNAKYTLYRRNLTHDINNVDNDQLFGTMQAFHFDNDVDKNVKVILVPSYLNGDDGIFNKSYYDLLIGLDLTIFASYYEPWGYTPLESVAFSVPTITTNLAGFGLWVSDEPVGIQNGVAVINRNDHNYFEVANEIHDNVVALSEMSEKELTATRKKAKKIADGCSWNDFVKYYEEAFKIALQKR
ncbi:MAG: glycogen/starch synthase [Paludibacteraceae bacterium]|nr:glycogen/starch synthase [Paludibacteraceae bacterium]